VAKAPCPGASSNHGAAPGEGEVHAGKQPGKHRHEQEATHGQTQGDIPTATLIADLSPEAFRGHGGVPAVDFEAAAITATLALLGQVLEPRRS
jgi:hypothetical protein